MYDASFRGQTEGYLTSPDGRVRITIWVRVKPDQLERAREVMREKIRKSRKEPGTILYDAWSVPDEPTEMMFLAEFETMDAVREHEQSDFAQAFYATLPEILEEPVRKTFWYGLEG